VTQVGKAPPSPEMTLSGLTRGQFVGEYLSAKKDSSPALPDVAARPSGGLFRFWAQALQRLSANHFAPSAIPHRSNSAVKHRGGTVRIGCVEPGPARLASVARCLGQKLVSLGTRIADLIALTRKQVSSTNEASRHGISIIFVS
jgi:hypothetical protein